MKFNILTLIIAFFSVNSFGQSISLKKAWESDTLFKTPESALYYKEKDIIFVTNMNSIHDDSKDGDGFISILDPSGKISNLKWVTGLNDPKGLAAFGGSLYVGDLTQLVIIDIERGTIIKKIDVDGSLMLNDVAILPNGDVFVTDTRKNKVYKFSQGKISLLIENENLNRPNGIFADGPELLLASMGSGKITKLDPNSKNNNAWVSGTPSADGIAKDSKGNYFVSNWNGEIYLINPKSEVSKILDTKDLKINAADIDYSPKQNLIFVPTFFKNKVVAYEVKY